MTTHTLSMTAVNAVPQSLISGNADWDHDTWDVTLSFQGRTMTLEFHTGSGLRRDGQLVAPSIGDILSCLASDTSSAIDARSFEEWAADLGFDTDSRRAEETFKAVAAQTEELRELLGEEFLEVVAYEAPNDGDWSEFRGDSIELTESEV